MIKKKKKKFKTEKKLINFLKSVTNPKTKLKKKRFNFAINILLLCSNLHHNFIFSQILWVVISYLMTRGTTRPIKNPIRNYK